MPKKKGKTFPRRILGIDPGFGRLGIAVIEARDGAWVPLCYGCLETKKSMPFTERLQALYTAVHDVVKKYKPTCATLEKLFFSKNVTTAIQVGEARGVVLLACADAGVPIIECTPNEVKQAVTGYGKADKKQIQQLVMMQLGISGKRMQDDAADALAIALAGGALHTWKARTGRG